MTDELYIVDCIRDDSTDCDCPRCEAAEERFWEEQGEDADRDAVLDDEDDREPDGYEDRP